MKATSNEAVTCASAVGVAESFHATLELDGVILTRLDGDARGGAALSVKEVVGRPIAFASTIRVVSNPTLAPSPSLCAASTRAAAVRRQPA